ncbi:hypothetical protein [Campylobacter sp. RM16188]|uniref:hypothetical protein n=1 Tax=Campylobacter sp. RM16188 TaxID=1705725 RepID=UPI001552A88C|nr:hypothetical protein [Campylobacter sp. RM16188]
MSFSIRRFFSILYLSVVIEAKQCLFYGKVMRGGKVIKTVEAKFDNDNENNINDKIINYLKRQQKEYKWLYLALFFDSLRQGALPCRSDDDFKKFGIDLKSIGYTKVDKNWYVYADLIDIAEAKAKFKNIGVDLIFSPIALLHKMILQKGLSEKNTLYIYNHKDSFALCIASHSELKFGAFAKTTDTVASIGEEAGEFDKESIDDIDDFIAEVDSSFESLDSLDSLDDLVKTQGNEEDFADLDYDINMPNSSDVTASVSIFGRDMSMYQYITSALREFYSNPLYESDFIEQIIIFDNAKTSATFLHFLETELLVETSIYPINTLKLMTELMIDEAGI